MAWTFSPPVVEDGAPYRADADAVTQRLWGHLRPHSTGVSVLKTDGTYVDQQYPYQDALDAADIVYLGGHRYEVSTAERADLVAAGYTVASTLLDDFGGLWRASEFTGSDGDPWVNEGPEGSAYNALAYPIEGDTLAYPHFVTSPYDGFEITAANLNYYYVPDGPGIEPDDGSFTAFAKFYWPGGTGGFDNIMSKVQGGLGSGGRGWQFIDYGALGGPTFLISDGGTVLGPGYQYAGGGGVLSVGEHLLVGRLDRSTQTMDLFVDGSLVDSSDASGISAVTASHELIFGRGKTQTNRAYGVAMRALTATEITVELPALLAA